MDLQTQRKPVHARPGLYLDFNATTPLDADIFKKMEPYFQDFFGNPSSQSHQWGWKAENATQKARMQVAKSIGAKASEIIFTSGATEANNWVILGLLNKLREENANEKIHFITSQVEHSSIMKAMAAVACMNVEVDFLPVNSFGQVEIETLRAALKPHTKLVSLIWVNNEIGSINPIVEIAKLTQERGILLHTDGTQAIGKMDLNMTEMGIDFLSFSAHKIYGPKGAGALYLRESNPRARLNPLIHGGGQERGLRSGTLNVPALVGMGYACEKAAATLNEEVARCLELRDYLWNQLTSVYGEKIKLNGHPTERSAMNLNFTLKGCPTADLLPLVAKLGISTGSACASAHGGGSHVLQAIGCSADEARSTLRLSLGRETTREDLDFAVSLLKQATEALNL